MGSDRNLAKRVFAGSFPIGRYPSLSLWPSVCNQCPPESTRWLHSLLPLHGLQPLDWYITSDSHFLDRLHFTQHEALHQEAFVQLLDLACVNILGQFVAKLPYCFSLSRRIVDLPTQAWSTDKMIGCDAVVLVIIASLESETSAGAYPRWKVIIFTWVIRSPWSANDVKRS